MNLVQQNIKENILNDMNWIQSIEQQSIINNISFEDQLNTDIRAIMKEYQLGNAVLREVEITDNGKTETLSNDTVNITVDIKEEKTLKDKIKEFYDKNKMLVIIGGIAVLAGTFYLLKSNNVLSGTKPKRKKRRRLNGLNDHLSPIQKRLLKERELI